MGCRLWGRTESDTTEATQQQRQHLWDVRNQGIRDDTKTFSLNNRKDIIADTLMKGVLGIDFEEITWNSVLNLVNLRCQ